MRQSPGRRQAGDVERLLDRQRHAEQWQAHALGELRIAIGRLLASALEVANDDGIDRTVEPAMRRIAASQASRALSCLAAKATTRTCAGAASKSGVGR